MSDIRSRAILVALNIGQWTARKLDKSATNDVTMQNRAAKGVARVTKDLLPFNNELDQVTKTSAAIRQRFYAQTLPWMDGIQLLPTANYLNFTQEFRHARNNWLNQVDAFLQVYATARYDAQRTLGDLFREDDYPTSQAVERKFSMEISTMPLPDNDFRIDLSSDAAAEVRDSVQRDVAARMNGAMSAAWERLYGRVQKMAEKLADPDAIFRDTLVENARECCDVLSRLNFADDPNLETLRREVETKLAAHNPDTLRHDPLVRRTAADDAADIMARMASFMSGQ